jgi:hypothetical protein
MANADRPHEARGDAHEARAERDPALEASGEASVRTERSEEHEERSEEHEERSDSLCRCGRVKTPRPHCPNCGSASVLSREKLAKTEKLKNGTIIIVPGFVCRLCSQKFQKDWVCGAPPPKKKDPESLGEAQKKMSPTKLRLVQLKAQEALDIIKKQILKRGPQKQDWLLEGTSLDTSAPTEPTPAKSEERAKR